MNPKIRVIAHRGARSLAPENTLAAARMAHEIGADAWETDVNLTRDGRLILFHDQTLLRCTDVKTKFPERPSYRVDEFDLKDIRALDAGSFFNETDPFREISKGAVSSAMKASYMNEPIPLLEEGLDLTFEKGWKINLELKHFKDASGSVDMPDLTLRVLKTCKIPLSRVVISSFHHPWLFRIMDKEPLIEVQALVGDNDTEPLDFKNFSFSTYNANADLITPDQIRELKNRGKTVNLFTVNDPKAFTRFVSLGVDGIFTDFPQRFVRKPLP